MPLPKGWTAVGDSLESGQAWVHRAVRENGDDHFALKRLKNLRRRKRFSREVQVMQRLALGGCPAIPPIIDADLEADRPWYAMPWYEGGSLEQVIERDGHHNDVSGSLGIARDLASAISDVHAAAVAHRDLKPSNVLFDDGTLKLGDFGLCLDLDGMASRLTETDEPIGSRLYVAPENEGGINEETDQRPADFYAFGKILWAVFTGRPPLPRERILEQEHSLAHIRSERGITTLDGLMRDLLNRDPRVRLHDWEVVLRELDAFEATFNGTSGLRPRGVRRDVVAAARRIKDLPAVSVSRYERESHDQARFWVASVVRHMLQEARSIELSVGDLVIALDGVLTVTVTTGGSASAALMDSFEETVDKVVKGASPAIRGGSEEAVVLMVHSPQAVNALPTVAVRIWPVSVEDSLWIISAPTISRAGEPERACSPLARWFLRASGPHPKLRQSTVIEAGRFVNEIARLFVSFAEEYVLAAERGLDPVDPDAWGARDLLPGDLSEHPPQLGDGSPPDLRTFELMPKVVEIGSDGGRAMCRTRLVDDVSGVAGAGFTGSRSQARLRSQSGQLLDILFDDSTRVAGDRLDGVYEAEVRFAPAAERGRWEVEYVLVVDQVGNQRYYTDSELRALGLKSHLDVR